MTAFADWACIAAPSEDERMMLAGDPLSQRGALIDLGRRVVPGVSPFLRYPRALSLACLALHLAQGSATKRRAVEGLFMHTWRNELSDDKKGFYTRGQQLAAIPFSSTLNYQEVSRHYVKVTLTDQLGYSLASLGFAHRRELTLAGRTLANVFCDEDIQRDISKWLAGMRLPRSVPAELTELSPQHCSESEIIRGALYDKTTEGQWRKRLAGALSRYSEDTVREEGLQRLSVTFGTVVERALLKGVWVYERLRQYVTEVELPHMLYQILNRTTRPTLKDRAELKRRAEEAERSPAPQTHSRATALIKACLEAQPVQALFELTGSLCHVDNTGDVRVHDLERAERIAVQAPTSESSSEPDNSDSASYRTYQLWNLWQLHRHLNGDEQ